MEERFYLDTARRLLAEGWLRRDDTVRLGTTSDDEPPAPAQAMSSGGVC